MLLAFTGLVIAQPAEALVLNAIGIAPNFNEGTQTRARR